MSSSTKAGHGIEVGAIFYSMWGYDQTNVDYYEVTRATPKTVTLRKIGQRRVESVTDLSETVEPMPGDYRGEPFRRTVHAYMGGSLVIESFMIARPWDGQPKHASHWN